MKLTRFDIGGEIISILTKGMYPDPRDAVREYIQNAIDARAAKVTVKVRSNSVTIHDNGIGMNYDKLRKAVRVGISEKNPSKDVGFMGIGIYSAFHLCDKLVIYSHGDKGIPNKLTMDFDGMKTVLKDQKELRLKGEIEPEKLIDLQALLETFIEISEDSSLSINELPIQGTRVELLELEPVFSTVLSDFKELSNYLREVIPLRFQPKENFVWGPTIEEELKKRSEAKGIRFEIVDLHLQVGATSEDLYRPYTNEDFNNKLLPKEPIFTEVEKDGEFFGVIWGCLNSIRRVVDNKNVAGFILKKQGFSIGARANLVKHFSRGKTYFDRYIGEVIILNPELLPNAARNDLEFTELRTKFYNALQEVADKYDEEARNFQEWSKADEELGKIAQNLRTLNAQYNTSNDDTEILLDLIVKGTDEKDKLLRRIKRGALSPGSEEQANQILHEAESLRSLIQEKINALIENKKVKRNNEKAKAIARNLSKINLPVSEFIKYESLLEMLLDIDIAIPEGNAQEAISTVDELFIINPASNREEYYISLNKLKEEILRRVELDA